VTRGAAFAAPAFAAPRFAAGGGAAALGARWPIATMRRYSAADTGWTESRWPRWSSGIPASAGSARIWSIAT